MFPGKEEGPEPLWTRQFILVSVTAFFTSLGFHLYLPTLPLYIQAVGGAASDVGLITGLGTFAMVVTRPYLGREMDRLGRTKILFWGMLVYLLSTIMYNFTGSIWHVFLVRMFHGLGWGAVITALNTLGVDSAPHGRRGEGVGFYGLFHTTGVAIGPVLGLAITRESPPFHFHIFFLTSSAFALIGLVLAAKLSEPKTGSIEIPKVKRPALPYVIWPIATLTSLTFAFGAIVTFVSLYAKYRAVENIGWYFTVFALALMVIRPLAGKLSDVRGRIVVIIPGLIVSALAVALLVFCNSLFLFLMDAVLFGLGFGAAHAGLMALTVDQVPPEMRGAAMGLFGASFDLGIGLGALLSGLIVQLSDYEVMYLFGSGIILVGLAGFAHTAARRRRKAADSRQ